MRVYIPKPYPPFTAFGQDTSGLGRSYIPWGIVRQELIRNGAEVKGNRSKLHQRIAVWQGIRLTFYIHRFYPSKGGTCWRVLEMGLKFISGHPKATDLTAALDTTGWEWTEET